MVGPFRPDAENKNPPPTTTVGIASLDVPETRHRSIPVSGS
jgi:hypothetical protein